MSLLLDANVNVDVNKLADQLAKLAGPIAAHGWEVYVRQQYVEGFQNLFSAAILLAISVGLLIWIKVQLYPWAENYEYDDKKDDGMAYLVPAIVGVVAMACAFFFLLNLSWAIGHLVNPEYGAIQEILGRDNH